MEYALIHGTLCFLTEDNDYKPCKCQYNRDRMCDKECSKFEIKQNKVILNCPEKRTIEISHEKRFDN